jgi:hypothetical protein
MLGFGQADCDFFGFPFTLNPTYGCHCEQSEAHRPARQGDPFTGLRAAPWFCDDNPDDCRG